MRPSVRVGDDGIERVGSSVGGGSAKEANTQQGKNVPHSRQLFGEHGVRAVFRTNALPGNIGRDREPTPFRSAQQKHDDRQ